MHYSGRTVLERIVEQTDNIDFLRKAATLPRFEYVAQLILNSQEIKERAELPWEYKPYIEFVEEEFVLRNTAWWASNLEKWEAHVAYDFSNALSLEAYCTVSGFGPALYVREENGNYREAGNDDADYAFVRRMFLEEEIGLEDLNIMRPPLWAKNLYLYRPNWEAYRAISRQTDPRDHDFAETTRLKKIAIRWLTEGRQSESAELCELKKTIEQLQAELMEARASRDSWNSASTRPITNADGSASAQRLSFRYETRPLHLVAAVQERFLGRAFDPNDVDTRPSQNQVLAWLKTEKGVPSDAEARAIDRVAMPFSRAK